MYPLLESIAIKDGELLNISYHEARFMRSYFELYGHLPPFNLLDSLGIDIPAQGLFKLRVLYGETSKIVEKSPYSLQCISTLRCVDDPTVDYHLKYTDRGTLNDLYAQRQDCDDILIIKEGKITDTFAGNILFFDGKQWYTPDSPLLQGTQRAFLLAQKIVKTATIDLTQLKDYRQFMVINALRSFDLSLANPISGII